ncbi:MAG: hypothetical protein F4X04_01555 [Holophagales bacterium]|nr:hypothetical protein [Holophagales bacterium]
MTLDGDHSAEPCHVVVLHHGHFGLTKIEKTAVCTDEARHGEDKDSPLKARSALPETDEERQAREEREAKRRAEEEEEEERLAAEEAQSRRLTDHLLAVPDEAVIATVVRRQARSVLHRPPNFEDPLLPVPEGVVDPDHSWMFPTQVIDDADSADLARVVLRWWLIRMERGFYHNKREMGPVIALVETLPAPTEGSPTAEEEVA